MRAPDTLPLEVERDLAAMDAAVAGQPSAVGDPALAELAALVAEGRPTADPAWARSLDVRAARGFARHAAGPDPRRAGTRRPGLIAGLSRRFALPALGLAACAVVALGVGLAGTRGGERTIGGQSLESAGAGASSSDAGGGEAGGATAGDAADTLRAGGGNAGGGASDGRSVRKVESSAAMTLRAPRGELDTVAGGAARVATTLGGFVAASSLSSRSGGNLDLRVPAARLDDAIARLSRLAHVRRLERSTLDITAESVSARARVAELRAERRSLLRQLAAAASLTETARVRNRLAAVTHRIVAARTRARGIDNRAAYATVSVTLMPEPRAAADPGPWTPGDAWHDALRGLEVAAGVAVILLAVAVPLTLLALPAWLAGRSVARRRREAALDAA
jgi:hypothetical protein